MLSLLLLIALIAYAMCDPTDGYVVSQIHIAQGKTPESMTISWVTKAAGNSEVKFGKDKNLSNSATGYSTTYKFDYPQYGVYESGVIHHVELHGLDPASIYFYQCGDFSAKATSGLLTFETLPAVGDHRPLHFAVIGDLGQTTDSTSTVQHVLNNPLLRMILHAGDLSYADCNQQLWDSYGVLIEDLAKER